MFIKDHNRCDSSSVSQLQRPRARHCSRGDPPQAGVVSLKIFYKYNSYQYHNSPEASIRLRELIKDSNTKHKPAPFLPCVDWEMLKHREFWDIRNFMPRLWTKNALQRNQPKILAMWCLIWHNYSGSPAHIPVSAHLTVVSVYPECKHQTCI